MDNTGNLQETIFSMLKVDLHRHLIGSVKPQTFLEVAREYNIPLPTHDLGQLKHLITISKPVSNLRDFLKPLKLITQCFYDEDAIAKITYEAVRDAYKDNIRYLELIVGSAGIALAHKLSLDEVYRGVIKGVRKAENDFRVKVGLIDGPVFKWRKYGTHSPEEVLEVSLDHKKDGVVGFGLSSESKEGVPFSRWRRELRKEYIRISKIARESGLHVTVHAGETSGAESVKDAIEILSADRIGHGVNVVDDPEVLKLLVRTKTPLEICLTSNILSGVVKSISQHPFKMLYELGAIVTLNTDDPSLCQITLTDEYVRAVKYFNLNLRDVKSITLNAVKASFLPLKDKKKLLALFKHERTKAG